MCFRLVADNLGWVCTMLVLLALVPLQYLSILCKHRNVESVTSLGWFIRVPFFAWAVKVVMRQSKATPIELRQRWPPQGSNETAG